MKVFQLSCPMATAVIFVAEASCHPSTLTGLAAEAWSGDDRGQHLCREGMIGCDVGRLERGMGWGGALGCKAARRSVTKVRGGVLS